MGQPEILKALILIDGWATTSEINEKLKETGENVQIKAITQSLRKIIKMNWVEKKYFKVVKKHKQSSKEWDIPYYRINKKI